MAGGNNVNVSIDGSESVSTAAAQAAAAIDALKDKKITVNVDIDKSKVEEALKDIDAKAKAVGKDTGSFELDTDSAHDKLDSLKEKAKGFGGDSIKIDIDVESAEEKLDRLHQKASKFSEDATKINLDAGPANSKLDRLRVKKGKFESEFTKISLDAGPANSKLDRLGEKQDNIFGTATTIQVDAGPANSKLDRLKEKKNNIFSESVSVNIDTDSARESLNGLAESNKKIKIKVNTVKAVAKIAALQAAIESLNGKSVDIDIDTNSAITKATALKAVLDGLGDEDINFRANIDNSSVGKLRRELDDLMGEKNLIKARLDSKELSDDFKKASSIDLIGPEDGERLKSLRRDLRDLKRERKGISPEFADELEYDIALAEKSLKKLQDSVDQKAAKIRAVVDIEGAEKIAALDAAIDAINRKIEVEVDIDRSSLQQASAAGGQNRTITVDIESRGVPELMSTLAFIDSIGDKKVRVNFEVNGLTALADAHTMLKGIKNKDVTVNIDTTDTKKIGNGKDGVSTPVVKKVILDVVEDEDFGKIFDRFNRETLAANKARKESLLSDDVEKSNNQLKILKRQLNTFSNEYDKIAKNNSLDFKDIKPRSIKISINDDEINRYQKKIDALENDKKFIGPEIEARKLGQLTRMRQELEKMEMIERSRGRVGGTTDSIVVASSNRRKLRKQIEDFEKDMKANPIRVAAEMEINDRQIRDLQQKISNRKNQLSEPIRKISIDDSALKNAKRNLSQTNIKIKAILDRDSAIDRLKSQKEDLEKTPIKFRTQADNTAIKNISKDLKELQNIKRKSASLDDRLSDRNRYQSEIKQIKAIRTALNDKNNSSLNTSRISAQVNTAAAAAKIAELTRDRSMNVDVDLNERSISNISRRFNSLGQSISRGTRGAFDALGDDDRIFQRSLGNFSRYSNGINSGIAKMTNRIPLVGGLFKGLASLGDAVGSGVTKLAGLAGAGPKLAGSMGGVASAVVSVGSALLGLGIVGVVGTGVITAGAYAATAALGTVAGVVGVVGAAIGGAFIGGFAYLVKDMPVVSEAFSKLGDSVSSSMKKLAEPVAIPLANTAPKLQAAFDQVSPSISRIASQTGNLITELGDKLPAVAKQAGPALQKMFDFGETSANSFMDNLPDITKSLGEFFGKLSGPEVSKAVDSAFAAIPGIIGAIGTGIDKAASGFNNLQSFMGSKNLDPMREGFEKFSQSLSNTDWSSATDGITNAMNAFGGFAGSIDMQNISDGIGGVSNALANFTDIAAEMNLDGIFKGLGKGLEGFSSFLPFLAKSFGLGGSALTEPFKKGLGAIIDDIKSELGGPDPITVDGPSIELNPNISVKEQDAADVAERILGNIDGQTFGSADAAERIIAGLQADLAKTKVNPKIAPILDEGTIAKNINSENIGNLLKNRIGDGPENAIKIPIQTAMDIETAAGKDGLNVMDTVKDQLSKLTGLPFEEINIEVPVGTTLKVSKNADGSIGDLIKASIDDVGNLQIEVVATAEVVAKIGGITGLNGNALDSFLDGMFGGQTISKDLAVQIKANMGLADASMSDFESALESQLSGVNGKQYDVQINADGTVKINVKGAEIPEMPPIEAPKIPDVTSDVAVKVAFAFGADTPQALDSFGDELKSLGQAGGESIEITKEIQVALEAIVGGGSQAEVEGKIKELISKLTGIPVDDLDIEFDVNGKPKFNLFNSDPTGEIKNKLGQTLGKGVEINPDVNVNPNYIYGKGKDAGAELKSKLQVKDAIQIDQTASSEIKVKVVPDTSLLATAMATIGSQTGNTIRVMIIPDVSLLAMAMATIGSQAGNTIRVMIIPDISMLGAALGGLSGIQLPPIRIQVIPDIGMLGAALGGLGGMQLPPIRIPIIVDPPVVPNIVVPPVRIPSVVEMPAIPNISVPPVRIPVVMDSIPAVPNTTSQHRVVVVADPLPNFPNTTSGHHVSVTHDPLPSFPPTSSTHTINVVVNGSGPGAASTGNIMTAPLAAVAGAMGAQARGIGAAAGPAMGASGISGSAGARTSVYDTGKAISTSFAAGLSAGTSEVEAALMSMTSLSLSADAYANMYNEGKLSALGFADGMASQYGIASMVGAQLGKNILSSTKVENKLPEQIKKGFSWSFIFGSVPSFGSLFSSWWKPVKQIDPANNANRGQVTYYNYTYQTNNFDGGLVGDPELQASRVLDALEQSPQKRRMRKVMEN